MNRNSEQFLADYQNSIARTIDGTKATAIFEGDKVRDRYGKVHEVHSIYGNSLYVYTHDNSIHVSNVSMVK